MPDNNPSIATAEVRAQLHTIAELIRHVHHLGPEAQTLLADLVEELSKSVGSSEIPSAEFVRLTECAKHLVQVVHKGEESGVLDAARGRLERAVIAVETRAPGLANITRQLAEMLSDLGI